MPAYRLQTVLEIRERAKEAAEKAFVDAQREHLKAQEEQKRLEAELLRRQQERKAKVAAYFAEVMKSGAAGVSGLSTMNRFEDRLKDEEAQLGLEIESQKEVVKAKKAAMEQKRMEMAEAAKELKAIEKHKETWAKQVKDERDKREELVQEEIGNTLHLARVRKGDLR